MSLKSASLYVVSVTDTYSSLFNDNLVLHFHFLFEASAEKLTLRTSRGASQKFIFSCQLELEPLKIPSTYERKKDVSYVKNSEVYTCCCKI